MGNRILSNSKIATAIYRMVVNAPEISKKRKSGQFVIIRVALDGERIPLTISDVDVQQGTLTLIYQVVGETTAQMALLNPGDHLQDLVGPLGKPTHIETFGLVVCVGGGIGIAPIFPIVQAMKKAGNTVISILGVKSKDRLILREEIRQFSDELIVMTDDGSLGTKGFVTHALQQVYDQESPVSKVIAIGPPIMMQKVSELTKPYHTSTVVSLNPIMVDGTGMCGGCRVVIDGNAKFACVDGPEFDGHLVDYENLIQRLNAYKEQEQSSFEDFICRVKNNPKAKEIVRDLGK